MAAKLAAAKGLDPDQVIVERAALDELLDRRFELNLALGDVERALADERAGDAEVSIDARRQLDWLVEHVRRLTAVPFGSIGSAGQTG